MNVFFSWQSDLPSNTNTTVIRGALKQISDAHVEWKMDEATRNTSGSPDISLVVENKIRCTDVLIADVSLINGLFSTEKKTPNPNVLFELGIACGIIGWNRIVLVFNKAYGDVENLPFDISKHRSLIYEIPQDTTLSNKEKISVLKSKLEEALTQIEQDNPLKRIFEGRNPEEIKHNRDVNKLLELLRWIDLSALSSRADDGARYYRHDVAVYSDCLDMILKDASFSLYDKETEGMIRNIKKKLDASFSFHYSNTGHPKFSIWSLPFDVFPSHQEEVEFRKVQRACNELKDAVSFFIRRVQENYLEIDLDKTNQMARKNLQSE